MTTLIPITVEEQTLLGVVRRLPPERVSEVIDFARFLHHRGQSVVEYAEAGEHKSVERLAQGDARWDALLATEESQRLLEQMADEALAETEAGMAESVVFTDEGEIGPG
jgi:hypothetical protein